MFKRDIKYYESRINLLKNRDPDVNMKIIHKLERKVRKLKGE